MKAYRASTPRLAGTIEGDTFSGRLHALRTHLCLTRKQFSDRVGLTIDQIGRLERGGNGTRSDNPSIESIARTCGVQPVWLYAGSIAPRSLWPDWWQTSAAA